MELRPAEVADRALVAELLRTARARPLQALGRLDPRWADLDDRRARWFASQSGAAWPGVVAEDGGHLVGALMWRPSAWESEHFGHPVLRATGPVVAPGSPEGLRSDLASAALAQLAASGRSLLIVDLDAGDVAASVALQGEGYTAFDTMLSFAAIPTGPVATPGSSWPVAGLGTVSAFDRSQLAAGSAASPAEVDALAAVAPALFAASHFHADPELEASRCDGVYAHWVRASFGGEWADWLLVARDMEGRLASFVSYQADRQLDDGPTLLRSSFGFSVPPQERGFTSALSDLVVTHAPGDLVLAQCQAHNVAQVGNFGRRLRFVAASLVFHGWSG